MTTVKRNARALRLGALLAAGLAIAGCAKNSIDDPGAANASAAVPGSQQDFVVNVGDRVFFESDSSELTSQAILPTLRRANAGAAAQALMTPHSQGINHCRRFAGGIRFSAISARLRQG